jgi:cytochrome c oxidase assembly protein subunit 15
MRNAISRLAALAVVIVQGVLGGLRVTILKDEIGIFHACLAQGFFVMLIVITLATSRLWRRNSALSISSQAAPSLARVAVVTTCVIYAQLALGATMRHQHCDLAILDFPAAAYGQLIPDVSAAKLAEINAWRDAHALSDVTSFQIWLQMTHRFLALVLAVGVIVCLFRTRTTELRSTPLSRFSDAWFLLLVTQITLGAWVIWSNKAADIATAHVAVGATMPSRGDGEGSRNCKRRLLHQRKRPSQMWGPSLRSG